FCLSVILWAMAYYPRLPNTKVVAIENATRNDEAKAADELLQRRVDAKKLETGADLVGVKPVELKDVIAQRVAAAQSEYSIAGRFGHALEPAIRPLGYDWKMGVGLVSAFAAREVF